MFSGIIESVQTVLSSAKTNGAVQVKIQKPAEFDDLKKGDSIAVNGVCLTVEAFDSKTMTFTYGAESLRLLNINPDTLVGTCVNLERSLKFGDRIHGHLVTGHVECLGEVVMSQAMGESWLIDISVPESISALLWTKGSITLNGVSLTINDFEDGVASVCLIPETIKRTNLSWLKNGDSVNLEADYLAKMFHKQLQQKGQTFEL